MNKVILLSIISFFLYSCTSHVSVLQMEMEAGMFASEVLKKGIINGRYYSFDGAFSVIAPSQPNNTKFSERSMPCGYAIIFESLNKGPTTCYDIYPIKDPEMLIELGFNVNYQKAFLKAFFFDNIFSVCEENCLGLKFVSEDFIIKDESIYYLAILNGPTETVSALVAIKDNNLIVISLNSMFPCVENLGATKQELSISLINYFEGFHIE